MTGRAKIEVWWNRACSLRKRYGRVPWGGATLSVARKVVTHKIGSRGFHIQNLTTATRKVNVMYLRSASQIWLITSVISVYLPSVIRHEGQRVTNIRKFVEGYQKHFVDGWSFDVLLATFWNQTGNCVIGKVRPNSDIRVSIIETSQRTLAPANVFHQRHSSPTWRLCSSFILERKYCLVFLCIQIHFLCYLP